MTIAKWAILIFLTPLLLALGIESCYRIEAIRSAGHRQQPSGASRDPITGALPGQATALPFDFTDSVTGRHMLYQPTQGRGHGEILIQANNGWEWVKLRDATEADVAKIHAWVVKAMQAKAAREEAHRRAVIAGKQ